MKIMKMSNFLFFLFQCHQNTSESHSPVNIRKIKLNVIQMIRDLWVVISLHDFALR